jgi:hypothetical protein
MDGTKNPEGMVFRCGGVFSAAAPNYERTNVKPCGQNPYNFTTVTLVVPFVVIGA